MYDTLEAQKELLRQTERQIEGQLSLAVSADQRAVGFAAAMLLLVILLVDKGVVSSGSPTSTASSVLILLSSGLAFYSAKPSRVFGSGGSASGLSEYCNEYHCDKLIAALCDRNDDNIKENDKQIKRSARLFRISLVVAFVGLVMVYASEFGWLVGVDSWTLEMQGEQS